MGIVGEIPGIVVEIRAQTVVVVEHGGDAVKPEAVKVVLGHPEFQVTQQEVEHAGLAVVEALGTPGGVVALGAVVEELPGGAVEHIDALSGIAHGVGVHHVQQDANAHGMGLVHQIFQVLGLAEPGRRGEEAGHLIAEGAVVGVLHDGHELHSVVARLLDAVEGIVGELPIGADSAFLLRHAHMGLVDVQLVFPDKAGVRPVEGFPVVGDLALEGDGLLVLHHPAGVQGDVLRAGHVGVHHGFDLAALPQGVVAGQVQLPVAVFELLQRMGGLVPAVEFALQVQLVGAGGPLPIVPAAVNVMEAVVIVGVGEVVQGLTFVENPFLGGAVEKHSQVNVSGVGLELGVEFQ